MAVHSRKTAVDNSKTTGRTTEYVQAVVIWKSSRERPGKLTTSYTVYNPTELNLIS